MDAARSGPSSQAVNAGMSMGTPFRAADTRMPRPPGASRSWPMARHGSHEPHRRSRGMVSKTCTMRSCSCSRFFSISQVS